MLPGFPDSRRPSCAKMEWCKTSSLGCNRTAQGRWSSCNQVRTLDQFTLFSLSTTQSLGKKNKMTLSSALSFVGSSLAYLVSRFDRQLLQTHALCCDFWGHHWSLGRGRWSCTAYALGASPDSCSCCHPAAPASSAVRATRRLFPFLGSPSLAAPTYTEPSYSHPIHS